jgi:hypothetical protein
MSEPIVIFLSIDKPTEFPFYDHTYRDSYARLSEFAYQRNIDLRYVLGEGNYKNGTFTTYWKIENNEFIHYDHPFKAKLIYIKSRTHIFDNERRVNNRFIEEICRDKYKSAQTFPEYFKKTELITHDTIGVLNSFSTDLVVLKPRYGSSGKDVQVVHKEDIQAHMTSDQEYIAQELIESSEGIDNLVSQMHELRIFVFNGDIKAAYLRLPAKNSYMANISQGATEMQITLEDIPNSTHELKNFVDAKFKTIYPRFYTIDVMYENGKPWIVELNDMPGVPDILVQPFTDDFFETLLSFLNDDINN